jgi:hypothetical protein
MISPSNKIIKIHGCSGAGKTTAVRHFMAAGVYRPIRNTLGKVEAYVDDKAENFVLGSYESNCGGMDTVGSAKEVIDLVDLYAPMGNVVFEGLLQSTYYGAMGTHSQKYGDNYIYAFMDTPIETCLERVIARRKANGTTRALNPQLTRDKHDTIVSLQGKLESRKIAFRHRTATLNHKGDLVAQLKELLK